MVLHCVTCHPTQVHAPRLKHSQRPVLDLSTPEGRKAELTQVTGYIPRRFTRIQTVTHRSTNPYCHMVIHSVTFHPTQVNAPRLNPSQRPVLDLPTPEGRKAELTEVTGCIPRPFTRPQTVTHLSTNPTVHGRELNSRSV